MTENEIKALLAIVVAYDNRRPSVANITAWHEQAERARWTMFEAQEAIHQHFMESTEFLMPAHVTAIIKTARRLPEHHVPELTAAKADSERVQTMMAEFARRFGWNRKTKQAHDHPALKVGCPHCHAGPGRPCARLATRGAHRGEHVQLSAPHPSRMDLVNPPRPADY